MSEEDSSLSATKLKACCNIC